MAGNRPGEPSKVYALQVNYHDYKSDLYGRVPGLYHRYVVEGSLDGENWKVLVDKEDRYEDTPNDYVELVKPQTVRHIRYNNVYVPMWSLSISGLRVFGHGQGNVPDKAEKFRVNRQPDRRNAQISWEEQKDAQGYNVIWGIAPDKLYSSWMVYDKNHLDLRSLNVAHVPAVSLCCL